MLEQENISYISNDIYANYNYQPIDFDKSIEKDYYVGRVIKKYYNNGDNSLDIGAHIGGFVHNMKKIGYDACGIDIYKNAVDFAKNMDQKVYESDFTNDLPIIISKNQFSLISFMETIYYFNDPEKVLLKTKDLLKENGILLIQTINGLSKYFNNNTFFSRYGDNVQFMPTYHSIKHWLRYLNFNILEVRALPRYNINQLLKYNKLNQYLVKNIGLFLNSLDLANRMPIELSDKLIIIAQKI